MAHDANIPQPPSGRNPPSVLLAEMLYPRPYWPAPEQVHDWHELVLVGQGPYEVETDDGVHVGRPGTVFYYPPGMRHHPRYLPGGSTQIMVLQWRRQGTWEDRPLVTEDAGGRLRQAMEWMIDSWPPRDAADAEAARGLATALLHAHRRLRPVTKGLEFTIREYVRHAMAEDLTLDDLAEVAGLSRYHFVRVFREQTGTTPMRFVTRMRAQRAARLVVETDLTLAEVAERVGLASASHVSRRVKDETGRSPRQLRRSRRT